MNPISTPIFQFFIPGTAQPAENYVVKFFDVGTSDPADIFTNAALTVPYSPAGQATLNAEGYAIIYASLQAYKIQIVDPDDAQVFLIDSVQWGSGSSVGYASNFTTLADANPADNTIVYIPGYANALDGGHGMFVAKAAGVADDGYIQNCTPDPSFSWFRIEDENGDVRAAAFGAILSSDDDDIHGQMLEADTYAASIGAGLRILAVPSVTTTISAMTFASPIVKFSSGAFLTRTATTWTFTGVIEAGAENLFHGSGASTAVLSAQQENARPEWFGALRDNSTDDLAAINRLFASGAKSFLFEAGNYHVSTLPTFPANAVIHSFGTVNNGGTVYIAPDVYVVGTGGVLRAYTLAADGGITAVLGINVGANVVAGAEVDSGTFLRGQAGVSTVKFRAGGRIYQYNNATGIITAGGVATNLGSMTLKTNTLVNVGDTLMVRGGGTSTANGNTTVLSVKIGATSVFSVTKDLSDSTDWFFDIEITLTDTGKVTALGFVGWVSGVLGQDSMVADQAAETSVTLTGDPTLQIVGTSNSNNFTQKTMSVDFIPINP